MAKAVKLPFFIHGEALYGRATEMERELLIGGYCIQHTDVTIKSNSHKKPL